MVANPDVSALPANLDGGRSMSPNPITIKLPVDGFENVARLVTGGIASRLEFGFETVDDVQLAIELVLRSIPDRDAIATISVFDDGRTLTVQIAPPSGLTLEQPLRALDGGGMELGPSLERLMDTVELRGTPEPTIVLSKKLPGQP